MRGQKNINNTQEVLSEKLPFLQRFSCNRSQYSMTSCTKGDRLCEYVMPLNIQKYVLDYDSMHADLSSTVKTFAKWTFFRILQVPGTMVESVGAYCLFIEINI